MKVRLFEEYNEKYLDMLYNALHTLKNLTQINEYNCSVTISERLYKLIGEPPYEEKTSCDGFVYTINCFANEIRLDLRDACVKDISETIQFFQSRLMYEMNDVIHDYQGRQKTAEESILEIEDLFVDVLRVFATTKKMLDLVSESCPVDVNTLSIMKLSTSIEQRIKQTRTEIQKNKLLKI